MQAFENASRRTFMRPLVAALRIVLAWLAGTAVAYLLASVAHTQSVLAGLTALGVRIPITERVTTTLGDLAGLWRYGVIIGLALALGLVASRAVPRRVLPLSDGPRAAWAGAMAIAIALLAMKLAFSFTPIAGARGTIGFALQCVAGAAGGFVRSVCLTWLRTGTGRHHGNR